MPSATAGYSGTPLPKKLGLREDARLALLNAPAGFEGTMGALPDGVVVSKRLAGKQPLDVIVLFVKSRAELRGQFAPAADRLREAGRLWVAWPKKSSKVPTDMTEHVAREVGLPRAWWTTRCAPSMRPGQGCSSSGAWRTGRHGGPRLAARCGLR